MLGWVIFGLISFCIIIVTVLIYSQYIIKRNLILIHQRLDTSRRKRMRDEIKVEKQIRGKVTAEHLKRKEENEKLKNWYAIEKTKLSKAAKNEFKKLESDRSSLDAKLDQLLGLKPGKRTENK